MKILVIGLDGADSEVLLGDERLTNFRYLLEFGCYGHLQGSSFLSPSSWWRCMATSQEQDLAEPSQALTIWEQFCQEGKSAIAIGVPDGDSGETLTFPESIKDKFNPLTNTRLTGFIDSTDDPEDPRDKVITHSSKQYQAVRHLLQNNDWDYFQFVDTSLLSLRHILSAPGASQSTIQESETQIGEIIQDYYLQFERELEQIFALLEEDTAVLIILPEHIKPQLDSTSQSNQVGFFTLAAANNPLSGEIKDTSLIDLAPTLLSLGGYPMPENFQGESLLARYLTNADQEISADEEAILRERLSGLGYIS